MIKNNYIKIYIILLVGFISAILYSQNQYKNMISILSDIKPFSHHIKPGFVEANYDGDMVSSIHWFDQDSIKFHKIFHYDINKELYLITEYRELVMVKEYFFNNHGKTERFIRYLFGDKFKSDDGYITEVQYNKDGFPIMHEIRSMRDDYIGHITFNYNNENSIIRETWFQDKNKIREFHIPDNSISSSIK